MCLSGSHMPMWIHLPSLLQNILKQVAVLQRGVALLPKLSCAAIVSILLCVYCYVDTVDIRCATSLMDMTTPVWTALILYCWVTFPSSLEVYLLFYCVNVMLCYYVIIVTFCWCCLVENSDFKHCRLWYCAFYRLLLYATVSDVTTVCM